MRRSLQQGKGPVFLNGGIVVNLCLYFQIHQPFRICPFRVRQIGSHAPYFNDTSNREIFQKVARKCYWPAAAMLQELLQESDGRFKCAFSVSGVWLAQCQEWEPELWGVYQNLFQHPHVEVLCETSHHSLAAVAHTDEFLEQVALHKAMVREFSGREPRIFRNTELIYSDQIGALAKQAGFDAVMVEGWEPCLPMGATHHHIFQHPHIPELRLLPRSYRRSDDIAFRFSNRFWREWPLTPTKYHQWMSDIAEKGGSFVGLFMDYETLGEHQWAETGIFEFFKDWVKLALQDSRFAFVNPSEALDLQPAGVMSVPDLLSWADVARDMSAWVGNDLQRDALSAAFALANRVRDCTSRPLKEEWRRLLTSDHFYYMSTKWHEDGDVHAYFSPFESPFDAYSWYMNILEDFSSKLTLEAADESL